MYPMSLSFQRQGLNFPGIAAPKSSNDGTEGNFDVDTGRSLSSTLALDEALRMLHDKVDFHIRRRVRWVPSDASTSIDEFEICARGRSQPDAGDIVVPYAASTSSSSYSPKCSIPIRRMVAVPRTTCTPSTTTKLLKVDVV